MSEPAVPAARGPCPFSPCGGRWPRSDRARGRVLSSRPKRSGEPGRDVVPIPSRKPLNGCPGDRRPPLRPGSSPTDERPQAVFRLSPVGCPAGHSGRCFRDDKVRDACKGRAECAIPPPWPPRRRDSWSRRRSGGNTSAGPNAPSGNASDRPISARRRRSSRVPETSNPARRVMASAGLAGRTRS